ncbi:MAG: tetratricopeptide repeat protein [Burkholderiaceae bacterium]|nr:tetratricopeptide repeat protein [Burkholderiaceae bacterium]
MSKNAGKPKQPPPLAQPSVAPVPVQASHDAFPQLHHFFEELKRRNIIRVAILYLVACWVVLEPTHVVFHMLEVPQWANRLVILLMAIGFPLVLLFAWIYEVTAHGFKLTTEVNRAESIRHHTGRKIDRAIIAALSLALAYFVADKFWISKHVAASAPVASATNETASRVSLSTAAVFSPPPHSIAVLPFANMSGDKEQEYFSDGLTEEVLNSLARIDELQVVARTSAFSFKGKDADISTIARKLNVGAVLEGSVRRSKRTVRVTVQLINAVTGFHVWSQTFDRDLDDVLKLQTEIATAVASALQFSLLGDVAAKIELGGTHNASAFDAYLHALKGFRAADSAKSFQTAIAGYSDAIRLDPKYALAFASRSIALSVVASGYTTGRDIRDSFERARADALQAIALAPELAEGHWALAYLFERESADFTRAMEEYQRAVALAPGNARILEDYGAFAVWMGRTDAGLGAVRHAVLLDPLHSGTHSALGDALYFSRRYDESIAAHRDTLSMDPELAQARGLLGLAYYGLGNFESARVTCEARPDHWLTQECLAVTYDKLGRHVDSEAVLGKLRSTWGDDAAFQFAEVYAQWGNTAKALDWLETALRLRGQGLEAVKTAPLLDPLRKEPRFQAVERALKFPN